MRFTPYLAALMGISLSLSASAQDNLPNNAYVTLSGTVTKITDTDDFELSYSGGTVQVDTNDYWPDLFKADAGQMLKVGDRVTVTGKVDDNLFTKKEIDATALSFRGKTYARVYRHSADDDEIMYRYAPYSSWNEQAYQDNVVLSGRITKIANDQEFDMDYGAGKIRVETDSIAFPSTERLNVGDRVTVYGKVDNDWFEKREIDATYIVRTSYFPSRS